MQYDKLTDKQKHLIDVLERAISDFDKRVFITINDTSTALLFLSEKYRYLYLKSKQKKL